MIAIGAERHPIGVFDSGIGGLSVLRALHAALPCEDFAYFADQAHAPYGEQADAYVLERSLAVAHALVQEHAVKALVVACNTATAAAIATLRATYPALPIVGIEPALKPSAALTRTGHVGVLATRSTLQSRRFKALRASLEPNVQFHCAVGEGLVEAIEHAATLGDPNAPELIALCDHSTLAIGPFGSKIGQMDVLVLGCTHYPFAWGHWQRCVGSEVALMEPGAAVARRTAELLAQQGLLNDGSRPVRTDYMSSSEPSALKAVAERWLASLMP